MTREEAVNEAYRRWDIRGQIFDRLEDLPDGVKEGSAQARDIEARQKSDVARTNMRYWVGNNGVGYAKRFVYGNGATWKEAFAAASAMEKAWAETPSSNS